MVTLLAELPRRRRLRLWMLLPLVLMMVAIVGCQKESETIRVYSVPKHESLQTLEYAQQQLRRAPRPERMIAAIVPKDGALWFFKLQGPPDAVATRESEMRDLLKSLKFTADGSPEWTLPSNWEERPGAGMRYRTMILSGNPPLEATVTTFPAAGDNLSEMLLANVNRWRGQLSLGPLELADLPSQSETIQLQDSIATLVNYVGTAKPAGGPPMGGPPPAEGPRSKAGEDKMGLPAGHPPVEDPHAGLKEPGDNAPKTPASPPKATPPTDKTKEGETPYVKPDEWTEVPPAPFAVVTFEARSESGKATISITRAGGDRVSNVNRWRGQVGLEPLEGEELSKTLNKFDIGDRPAELVELMGSEKSLFGVMIPDGQQTWFVKLIGDKTTAAQERDRFQTFAKSLKLP